MANTVAPYSGLTYHNNQKKTKKPLYVLDTLACFTNLSCGRGRDTCSEFQTLLRDNIATEPANATDVLAVCQSTREKPDAWIVKHVERR